MNDRHDVTILRDLARQYAELAGQSVQRQRRALWKDHLSLRPTRPPVIATFGMWNVWCREVFADAAMACRDPFYRDYERFFRMQLFHASYQDDWVFEPWVTVPAVQERGWENLWGATRHHVQADVEGGAWKFDPIVKDWSDVARLSSPPHRIDEAATRGRAQRLGEALGDLLAVHVERGPAALSFMADLSYWVAQLRGLEGLMVDMYESPARLHGLLAFLRDGVEANQAAAEAAGDFSAATQHNQCLPYADETVAPAPLRYGARRRDLWAFMAAQEYTGVSPAMHEEFLLRYQRPILAKFGLVAYGCCEDLTRKIDLLRQIPNLRIIAVTPRADVRRCAEQIGTDYVASWRPNPTDVISSAWDEPRLRRILREGLAACRGGRMHIHLKDVETVQGQPERFARWVGVVRDEIDRAG